MGDSECDAMKPENWEAEMHFCKCCVSCLTIPTSTYAGWSYSLCCAKTKKYGRVTGAVSYRRCDAIRDEKPGETCGDYEPKPILPPRDWRWLWLRRTKAPRLRTRWGFCILAVACIIISDAFLPEDVPRWRDLGAFFFAYFGGMFSTGAVMQEKEEGE